MAGSAGRTVREAFGWLVLVVGTAVFAATAAVVQAGTVTVGGRAVPYGLAVVLVMLGVGVRAAVWWRRSALGGVVVGVVWLVVTFVLARSGPGGDVLLPDGWRAQVYLLGGVVLVLVTVLVPLPPHDDEAGLDGAPSATAEARPDR